MLYQLRQRPLTGARVRRAELSIQSVEPFSTEHTREDNKTKIQLRNRSKNFTSLWCSQSINQSINRSDQSINQSMERSMERSINQWSDQSMVINQWSDQSIDRLERSINQSIEALLSVWITSTSAQFIVTGVVCRVGRCRVVAGGSWRCYRRCYTDMGSIVGWTGGTDSSCDGCTFGFRWCTPWAANRENVCCLVSNYKIQFNVLSFTKKQFSFRYIHRIFTKRIRIIKTNNTNCVKKMIFRNFFWKFLLIFLKFQKKNFKN